MNTRILQFLTYMTLGTLAFSSASIFAQSAKEQEPETRTFVQMEDAIYTQDEFLKKYQDRGREVLGLLGQLANAEDGSIKACPSNCACTGTSTSWAVTCVSSGCACMITGSTTNPNVVGSSCHCTN